MKYQIHLIVTALFLVKGTLFPQQTHRFSINYRYTDLLFGDIMPSRLSWVRYQENLVNQWPLANITQQAGTLTYQYKPEDKKQIYYCVYGEI